MSDVLAVIEAQIAAAADAYGTADQLVTKLRQTDRRLLGGAYEKLGAISAAEQARIQRDAYRQGLIWTWELLSERSWTGEKALYDNIIFGKNDDPDQ